MIMDRLYGCVCYAGIDTDPELKYPKVNICFNRHTCTVWKVCSLFRAISHSTEWRKFMLYCAFHISRIITILPISIQGAGRVAFSSQQSYIAAISARFVQLQHGDIDKRVEVKPYVLDDQMCDECGGQRCNGKFAPFFCANVICLQVSAPSTELWSKLTIRPRVRDCWRNCKILASSSRKIWI